MSVVTTRELEDTVGDALERVTGNGERILIQHDGNAVAAIVPIADIEALEDMQDRADLEAALAEADETGTKPLNQWLAERG